MRKGLNNIPVQISGVKQVTVKVKAHVAVVVESDPVDLLEVSLQLRKYQHDIVEKARLENTIAFLPTGAGKTLIACHLISSRMRVIRERIPIEGKLVAFIAPKKALLNQQLDYIEENCKMEKVKVKKFTGDSKSNNIRIEFWQKKEWIKELENCEVVGMTPAVMCTLLEKKIVCITMFDFVILDECHHVLMGNEPMSKLCDALVENEENYIPLILGLTASPVAKKKSTVRNIMLDLQKRMMSTFFMPSPETLHCLKETVNKPTLYTYVYRSPQSAVETNTSLLMVSDIRHHTEQLMILARTRMIHATHISSIYDVLVTVKGSPLDFPILSCLELAGQSASAVNVFKQRSTENHNGATKYSRVHGIEFLREIVHQVVEVAKDCGVHCALVALEFSLSQAMHFNMQNIQLNAAHWMEVQRQGAYHSVNTSKVDTTLLGMKTKEICDGPFFNQLHSVLFNQEVAVCSSLLDIFVLLVTSLNSVVLQLGLNMFQSTVSANAGSGTSSVGSNAFQVVCDILSFFVRNNGDRVDINHTVRHISLSSGMTQELHITPSTLSAQELMFYLRIVCSSIHSNISIDSLLARFDDHFTSSSPYDVSILPVFSNKIESLVDIWVSMSTQSVGQSRVIQVHRLVSDVLTTSPTFVSVTPIEWNHLSFNTSSATLTNNTRSNSTLVFCEMILTVRSLSFLFSRIQLTWDCINPVARCPLVPGFLSGDLSLLQQMAVLKQMKSQEINLLFASNVAEEGLDVQSCQLIVNYNGAPQTVKSFIQRRGRARAKHSVMVSLISDDKTDSDKMVNSLLTFAAQEQEMDRDLNTFIVSMNDMELSGDDEYVSSSGKSIEADTFSDADGTRYTTPNGAHVDTISSIALIRQYCESLVSSDKRGDVYSTVLPIFVTSVVDDNAKIQRFTCSLLLPQGVPQSARCIVVSNEARKKLVEGKASVAAVAALHRLGELDDNLRIPLLESVEGNQKQREMEIVSSMKDIRIKTVSDSLCPTEDSVGQLMYLYCFVPTADTSQPTGCFDCDSHLMAGSQLGIALYRKVSSEMLAYPIRLSIRKDVTLVVTMRLLCERRCSVEDVQQMTAFHRAMCDMRVVGDGDDNHWSVDSCCLSFPVPSVQAVLDSSTLFLTHLTTCARDAIQLSANIQLSRQDSFSPPLLGNIMSGEMLVELSGSAPVNQYAGLVVTDHTQKLMIVSPQSIERRRVRLDSVLKVVKSDTSDSDTVVTTTYQDQISKNNASLIPFLTSLSRDPRHHLLPVFDFNKKAPSFSLLKANKRERGKGINHMVPELCRVVGHSQWYYFGLLLPSVVHRVQSLLLACEARQFLNGDLLVAECALSASSGAPLPSLNRVLEAITPKMCLETFDSERLEMLGDSFLKFTMSVHLFKQHPLKMEGFLTALRGRLVSNLHLCEIAQSTGLVAYLRAMPLFGVEKAMSDSVTAVQQHVTATVKYKTLADLVEALIGAYLVCGGLQGGLCVMRRLGLFDEETKEESSTTLTGSLKRNLDQLLVIAPVAYTPPTIPQGYNLYLTKIALGGGGRGGLSTSSSGTQRESQAHGLHILPDQRQALESVLGYKFKSTAILCEALTHSSVQSRRSNERLEFLGDAVLDFLVVDVLYREQSALDQGGLTSAKSAVTCNKHLAQFTLKHKLYRNLNCFSFELDNIFKRLFQCNESTSPEEVQSLAEPVIKILGDLCEALVGAVYVDSGGDLSKLQPIAKEIMEMAGF